MNGLKIEIRGKGNAGEARAFTRAVGELELDRADAKERVWLELDYMFAQARKNIDPRTLTLEISEVAPNGQSVERQSDVNRRRYDARLIQAAGGKIVVRDIDKQKPLGNVSMHRDDEKGETTWMVEELPSPASE